MSTLVAILINFLITGLGMQETPEAPPEEHLGISIEIPDKTAEEVDQNYRKALS